MFGSLGGVEDCSEVCREAQGGFWGDMWTLTLVTTIPCMGEGPKPTTLRTVHLSPAKFN